jgi:hypothetical protein
MQIPEPVEGHDITAKFQMKQAGACKDIFS